MPEYPEDYMRIAKEMADMAHETLDSPSVERHMAHAQVYALLAVVQRLDTLIEKTQETSGRFGKHEGV